LTLLILKVRTVEVIHGQWLNDIDTPHGNRPNNGWCSKRLPSIRHFRFETKTVQSTLVPCVVSQVPVIEPEFRWYAVFLVILVIGHRQLQSPWLHLVQDGAWSDVLIIKNFNEIQIQNTFRLVHPVKSFHPIDAPPSHIESLLP